MSVTSHFRRTRLENREIERVVPIVRGVLAQLASGVRRRRWGLIIGEDTSGRIPTLMIGGAINTHYLKRGESRLPIVFIRGSKDRSEMDKQRAQVERVRPTIDKLDNRRALLITDLVSETAVTTTQMGALLTQAGIPFDVAAFGHTLNPFNPLRFRRRMPGWPKDTRFFFIQDAGAHKAIWHRPDLTGVQRLPKFSGDPVVRDAATRAKVASVRRDIRAAREDLSRGLF